MAMMLMTMSSKLDPRIEEWLHLVEGGELRACEDQHLLAAYVRRCFSEEDIYTDGEQLDKYLRLQQYFPFDLFPWERFVVAIHLCTYWTQTHLPRWPDIFCLLGRGAGKDGLIGFESVCVISPYNGIRKYDVDICANVSEQSTRPVVEVVDGFDISDHRKKLKKFFYWTTQTLTCTKTKSHVLGRTNNPGSRDGMQSGMVIYNEVHQYQNWDNVNVFTTSLGKKEHPRTGYFTSQGEVREGVLDSLLERSGRILRGEQPDNGLLPFLCHLDSREEVHDPENWVKANPSLPYRPSLMTEIQKEYLVWKEKPDELTSFMTKRMGLPEVATELSVTSWDNIKATNRPLPEALPSDCVIGIDYASTQDWVSVNVHWRAGDLRYDRSHSWLCTRNRDLARIRAPWQTWDEVTPVDDVEIRPELVRDYIKDLQSQYNILSIAMDNFRFALMRSMLESIGFSPDRKNMVLVKPSDIMMIQPVVASCFARQLFVWGDQPALRWATNNTKRVRSAKSSAPGARDKVDTGNFYYAKIEPKSRKTDPFMALVASMVIENRLESSIAGPLPDLGVIT